MQKKPLRVPFPQKLVLRETGTHQSIIQKEGCCMGMDGFSFGTFQSERQFHIKALPEEVGGYVFLVGDPGRCPTIAQLFDNPVHIGFNREYNLYTGTMDGQKVSVCSTGIGGPSAAIAVEELVRCGAHTFIRVGTCGGMDLPVKGGDLVIAQSAIRAEGTSYEYIPQGYPASANFSVICALRDAAEALGKAEYHVGVVQSKDSFYGETEPDTMPVAYDLNQRVPAYVKCGCLATEMECAAIFSVGLVRRVRCGAILTALWNDGRTKAGLSDTPTQDSGNAIACAAEAMRLLIARDQQ